MLVQCKTLNVVTVRPFLTLHKMKFFMLKHHDLRTHTHYLSSTYLTLTLTLTLERQEATIYCVILKLLVQSW